jgi:Reverse transcriptase (RNA-dependent DNA polymerase)
MKEVLHSFNDRRLSGQYFALKADINKAFDTIEWGFIQASLTAVGIPKKLVTLIMLCLASSKVTVQVNGKGSGYLTPTRGLQQGCPLKPYLYIIAMEFMTKRLTRAVEERRVRGMVLAPTAPRLTHALYADDVVIFGEATQNEVSEVSRILMEFGKFSGLIVNPAKSTV